jgi:hypothetical protein
MTEVFTGLLAERTIRPPRALSCRFTTHVHTSLQAELVSWLYELCINFYEHHKHET